MGMPETLMTERLSLRRLGPGNLAEVHLLFSSEGHTIGNGPVRDLAETANWLTQREQRYRSLGLAWYGLWDHELAFVGNCGVFVSDRCGDEAEIGYEVGLVHRGRGLAKEAALAVTRVAQQAGHSHVWATIRPSNRASAHLVCSIGYQFVRSQTDVKGPLDYYVSSVADRPAKTAV